MSRIRANLITNQSADGAPTAQNGLVITGVTTSTTFSGNIPASNITGTLPSSAIPLPAVIDALPAIYSVSPTSYVGTSGTVFTINGDRFDANTNVFFRQANGVTQAAGIVSFIGVTTITATTPNTYSAGQDLDIKVTSSEGFSGELHGAISVDGIPSFGNAAGTIATITDRYGTYTGIATLTATDPGGSSLTYSIVSGSLPGGCSLNSSTGVISGDPTDIGSASVTSNFTAKVTDDGGNSSTRAFSIKVNAAKDGTASYRAGTSALALKAVNSSISSGSYWLDPYTTVPANSNPLQYACAFSNTAADDGWITIDLSYLASNTHWAVEGFGLGPSGVRRNWNGTRLYLNSPGGGNGAADWKAVILDRRYLGRIDDLSTGCRDWDFEGYLGYQWGWSQFRIATKEFFNNGVGMSEGFSGSGGGTSNANVTNAASVFVQNNNSNNWFGHGFQYYNGTNYGDSIETKYSSGNTQLIRMLVVEGVLKVYRNGSLVQTRDLTAATNSPVTSSTKWYWWNYYQNPGFTDVRSLKVRNPA